ncbi:MAG: flagellar assembly peptidoglycan hydrolase FlgJ [Burkholderiales bacterium]|nr:MAG: flagellar assembly peptidoglycan hydrolase FlgJ [Burkholderiales bacterium]
MSAPLMLPQGLAADPTALDALRHGAGRQGDGGRAALKEAARQFESLFMRELIKSMREATMQSGLLDGPGSQLGNDLLDQQFAVQLSGLPGGLSQAIERQLGQQIDRSRATADVASAPPTGETGLLAGSTVSKVASRAGAGGRQAEFVARHAEAAARVQRESGIPAGFMLGQAGHETGWGRSEIRHRDGSPSFNLFGIKATSAWKGKVAEVMTTEYVDGVPRKTVAKFRAYDSYDEAFRDYARLIGGSTRYQPVMEQLDSVQGFAHSLQRAGYATDPQYAAKLTRAINMAMDLKRVQT